MSMTVLNVAFPFARVGPGSVGGAEQVLWMVDRGLVEAGQRSIVIACEGSQIAGELIATPPILDLITEASRAAAWNAHRQAIEAVVRRERVDLMHFHGLDFSSYLPDAGPPALVTLHLPPDWYPDEVFSVLRPFTHLQCVSDHQRRHCPNSTALVDTIDNGVLIASPNGQRRRGRFAAVLGRICPEKNLHEALDAAAMACVPLLLAGEVFPYRAHLEYFEHVVRPRLGSHARFIGPVSGHAKRRLLHSAKCVLIPSRAQETSSLVAMEALAAGTPVIAFRSGCLPEIVEDGATGFIVDDVEGMAHALDCIDSIEPERCRQAALQRFDSRRMVRQYLACYRRLASATSLLGVPRPSAHSRGAPKSTEPAQVSVSIVNTLAELRTIEAQWNALWKLDSVATVFQSPHWLAPWARRFSQGRLLTAALWDGAGALTALAPMYLVRQGNGTPAKLLPLGIGTTDYLDFLATGASDDDGGAATNALLSALSHRQHGWESLEVPQLGAASHLLRAHSPEGISVESAPSEPCSALALPASPEQFLKALPVKMAHNLKYYEHRARRAGSLSYSMADSSSLQEHVDALFDLHAGRWAARGARGLLSSKPIQDWHRDTIERLERAGLLRMHGLRLNGRLVAINYCLADPRDHGGAVYYYIGGFDHELSSLSPGTLLIGRAIGEAVREKAARFDFLRGREAYKALWGACEAPTYRRHFRRASNPTAVTYGERDPA